MAQQQWKKWHRTVLSGLLGFAAGLAYVVIARSSDAEPRTWLVVVVTLLAVVFFRAFIGRLTRNR
ncbi:hypothetical protein [Streptomyces sp. H27-C3]|uniref:hypothetical protein n=1 Tax=Streptomyces sp. H27-C3 TaxID=3046305 RepID=UPI0024B9CE66|nr:hypothetical protein [Streptomyces sp. H27-C3]MDJ0464959.1 hypothetical protein [Streptomyces sp. H27-C3]